MARDEDSWDAGCDWGKSAASALGPVLCDPAAIRAAVAEFGRELRRSDARDRIRIANYGDGRKRWGDGAEFGWNSQIRRMILEPLAACAAAQARGALAATAELAAAVTPGPGSESGRSTGRYSLTTDVFGNIAGWSDADALEATLVFSRNSEPYIFNRPEKLAICYKNAAVLRGLDLADPTALLTELTRGAREPGGGDYWSLDGPVGSWPDFRLLWGVPSTADAETAACARVLLEAGADPAAPDPGSPAGYTAAHYAAKRGLLSTLAAIADSRPEALRAQARGSYTVTIVRPGDCGYDTRVRDEVRKDAVGLEKFRTPLDILVAHRAAAPAWADEAGADAARRLIDELLLVALLSGAGNA